MARRVIQEFVVNPLTTAIPVNTWEAAAFEKYFQEVRTGEIVDGKLVNTLSSAQIENHLPPSVPDGASRVMILFYDKKAGPGQQKDMILRINQFDAALTTEQRGARRFKLFRWDISELNAELEGDQPLLFTVSVQEQAQEEHDRLLRNHKRTESQDRDVLFVVIWEVSSTNGQVAKGGMKGLTTIQIEPDHPPDASAFQDWATADFVYGKLVSHQEAYERQLDHMIWSALPGLWNWFAALGWLTQLILVFLAVVLFLISQAVLKAIRYKRLSPAMRTALLEGEASEGVLSEREGQRHNELERRKQKEWDERKAAFPARLAEIVKQKRAQKSNGATFVCPDEVIHSDHCVLPFMAATFDETMHIAAKIAIEEGLQARIVTVPAHNRSWNELEIWW